MQSLSICTITVSLASLLYGQPQNPRAESKNFQVDGVERTYLLTKPAQRQLAIPVLIVFHGTGGSGERDARAVKLHNAPFARNAVVLYPDALDQGWNTKDVAFVRGLIDDLLKSDKALDPTRVFAVGALSGGSFALRLACELSDRIAAVASLGGTLESSCAPTDAVPLLLAHTINEAAGTFDQWRKINQCARAAPEQAPSRSTSRASARTVPRSVGSTHRERARAGRRQRRKRLSNLSAAFTGHHVSDAPNPLAIH